MLFFSLKGSRILRFKIVSENIYILSIPLPILFLLFFPVRYRPPSGPSHLKHVLQVYYPEVVIDKIKKDFKK